MEWYINWSTEKQNIKLDIRSYFGSASQSWVVSSFSDSEDSNESEIDVEPNLPKKHCSSSTSKPPSNLDLESGDKMKPGMKHFPG